jgi:bifunctional non-homologous end joining protein LigD
MPLETYRKKRDFRITPEPRGRTARRAKSGLAFVIQKHAASHLHYDFRLELDGVLLSWAVPKGPSLDPGVRRLAMHVEDHPIEYGEFEGVIPPKQYGAGTVLLWDRGTWLPREDPVAGYRKGRLKFELSGQKLRGGWTLVRSGGSKYGGDKSWLLIKEDDGFARRGPDALIVDDRPKSVATGRTLEEIAADKDRVWHSNRSVADNVKGGAVREHAAGRKAGTVPRRSRRKVDPSGAEGAARAALPAYVKPPLPRAVKSAPAGEDWVCEARLEGTRMLCRVEDGQARLYATPRKEWTARLPGIARAVGRLPVTTAWLDGQVVALDEQGRSRTELLDKALAVDDDSGLAYFAFDLPWLNGYDLRKVPLLERKALLEKVLADPPEPLRLNFHRVGAIQPFLDEACKLGLGGVVARNAASRYPPSHKDDWVEVRCSEAADTRKATQPARGKPSRSGRSAGTDHRTVAGIAISNPDKVLYPEAGITKVKLAEYYAKVGDRMLPHLAGRPLTLLRCPNGWGKECFYQKAADRGAADVLDRVRVTTSEGPTFYVAANSVAAIVALLQMGVLEIHPWGSTSEHLDRPDRIVFDFDPADDLPWSHLVEAVKLIRTLLDEIGLKGFLRTTGGKGLHVVVPVQATRSWDDIKGFSKAIAELFVATFPDRFTAKMTKATRHGKIFVDYLRNAEGSTAIATYSLRARANAPVATPIAWEELGKDVRFDYFNVDSVQRRLRSLKVDPWKGFFTIRQAVDAAMMKRVGYKTQGKGER